MKLLVSVAVIVCLLAGWLCWRGVDESLTPIVTTPTPTAPGRDVEAADAAVAPDLKRLEVGELGEQARLAAESPASASPRRTSMTPVTWQVVILVVDFEQRPVADAVVTDASSRSGQLAPRTDAEGRVRLSLVQSFAEVSAAKDDQTSDARRLSLRAHADQVVKLVLDQPVPVRGVVLSAVGVPVAGAWVKALPNGISTLTRRFEAPAPEMVRTDLDGRFAVDLWFGHGYSLTARRDGEWTLTEDVSVYSRQPQEVTLHFPGAITVTGLVVDATGAPVGNATVRGWRAMDEGDTRGDYELLSATSDRDGTFSIPVKRHASYQLIANASGHGNSESVWFEPSEARPRATGTLRLVELATIAGVVEQDGGAPFAGVKVVATPMGRRGGGTIVEPDADNRFARPEVVTTTAHGRFAFAVHPATQWQLRAVPPGKRGTTHTIVRDVSPGQRDVTIRITNADLAGCVVQGSVRRADGGAVGGYQVHLVYYHDDGSRSGLAQADAAVDGNRFTVGPLSLGQQYGLLVSLSENGSSPSSAGPAFVGPFRTDAGQLQCEFVLLPWAELPVRIVEASGAPACGVTVLFTPEQPHRGSCSPQRVDDRGVVVLQRQVPRPGTVRIYGGSSQLLEHEVIVTSGLNPELLLRLPESRGR